MVRESVRAPVEEVLGVLDVNVLQQVLLDDALVETACRAPGRK